MSISTYDNNVSITNDMEAEDGFSSSMLTFAAVMTLLIMIVGIFGNFLTVAALIKCPKVRNVAAAFIMSLCIADLLFCALVLPFNAFRFIEGTWRPRDVLCKMIPFIQYGNIGVSLLCIAMITINRYVMIAHHSTYGKIYKRHWIAAMIIFCWVFSYGMQLPTLVGAWGTFDYDPKLGTCSILEDDHGHSSKTTLFVTAFVIPCIIIIACYTKIFWVVHKSEQRLKRHANKQNSIPNNLRTTPLATASNAETGNGQSRVSSADSSSFSTDVKHESVQKQTTTRIKDQREVRAKRNEWRITKMVLAIFLSFVICYLPITIAKVADQDVEHPNFHILSYIMLYLSACINPIIYVIMNKQYRKAYKTVIMCQPGRLLPFGKHTGGGGGGNNGNGSSVAEKWKDTGLSHMSHSRTMVSAVEPQNTSFSSSVQLPAMELSSKPSETTVKDTIESKPVTLQTSEPTPIQTSIENASEGKKLVSEELTTVASITSEQTPIPTPVQNHNNKNTNLNNNSSDQSVSIPTNIITPRTIKRIALVGGDIILEEEEEEEEENSEQQVKQIANKSLPAEEEKSEQTMSTPPPPSIVSQRPTPVYVNASVLHQKKNPSYGQNINVIPDNKNSSKLLTKTKL